MTDSPPPASLSDDPVEKRLEQLAARELRVAKREKEAAAKATELDRRLKLADDQEERLGTVAQREHALEQATHGLQQSQKDLKRREKAAKDLEHAAAERDRLSTDRELQCQAHEDKLEEREKLLDERDKKSKEDMERAQQLTTDAMCRFQRLEADEQDLKRQMDELQTTEKLIRRREQGLGDDEAELARRLKELREREDTVDKFNQALQVRQTALTQRELQNQSERDRLTKLSKQLSEEDKARHAEVAHLTSLRVELQAMQTAAEEMRHVAQREQDEATVRLNEASQKHNLVEKQMLELVQVQRELSASKAELSQNDADLKKRERRLATDTRDLEHNTMVLNSKKRDFDAAVQQLQKDTVELSQQRKELEEQKVLFEATRARHEKDFAALAQLEATLKRKSEHVSKKECELVQWMREIEWREVVLGDREANVDREPIPLTVSAPTVGGFPTASMDAKRGSVAGGSTMVGGGGATGLGVGRRQSTAPPTRVELMEDEEERKAYGKALVDVQLRRLKDRYVSAQLKWATLEVAQQDKTQSPKRRSEGQSPRKRKHPNRSGGGATDANPVASAMRVWTKAGIAVLDQQSHEEEVRRAATLESQRRLVHRLSSQLLRAISRMRAFDPNEPDDSPEKQQESSLFSDHEKTVVTFAVNFEFLMKHIEVAVANVLTSCPFDRKDAAVDAKDLLDKALQWWGHQRIKLSDRLSQLLQDRRKFLTSATHIIEQHRHEIMSRRGDGTLVLSGDDVGEDDEGNAAFETTEGATSPGESAGLFFGEGSATDAALPRRVSPAAPRRQSLVEHCAESPILGPSSGPAVRAIKLRAIEKDAAANRKRIESLPVDSAARRGSFNQPPCSSGMEKRLSMRAQQHCSGLVLAASTTTPTPTDPRVALKLSSPGCNSDHESEELASSISGEDERVEDSATCPLGGSFRNASTHSPPRSSVGACRTSSPPPLPHHSRTALQRPGTSESNRTVDFGLRPVPEDVAYCLVKTGRAQSADPFVMDERRRRRAATSQTTAGANQEGIQCQPQRALHTFKPPATWGPEHQPSIPRILQQRGGVRSPPPPADTLLRMSPTTSHVSGDFRRTPERGAGPRPADVGPTLLPAAQSRPTTSSLQHRQRVAILRSSLTTVDSPYLSPVAAVSRVRRTS